MNLSTSISATWPLLSSQATAKNLSSYSGAEHDVLTCFFQEYVQRSSKPEPNWPRFIFEIFCKNCSIRALFCFHAGIFFDNIVGVIAVFQGSFRWNTWPCSMGANSGDGSPPYLVNSHDHVIVHCMHMATCLGKHLCSIQFNCRVQCRFTQNCRLLAVPFWIVERACEPKTHSAARLKRGEINEKRLGGS